MIGGFFGTLELPSLLRLLCFVPVLGRVTSLALHPCVDFVSSLVLRRRTVREEGWHGMFARRPHHPPGRRFDKLFGCVCVFLFYRSSGVSPACVILQGQCRLFVLYGVQRNRPGPNFRKWVNLSGLSSAVRACSSLFFLFFFVFSTHTTRGVPPFEVRPISVCAGRIHSPFTLRRRRGLRGYEGRGGRARRNCRAEFLVSALASWAALQFKTTIGAADSETVRREVTPLA